MAAPHPIPNSEEEWRAVLSTEQFRILRQKGTELKGTGEYNKFFEEGIYNCAGCKTPLYKSSTKFDSGCGWPAFFEGLPGAILRTPDPDGRRTEITCVACGGHLSRTCVPRRRLQNAYGRAALCQQRLCQLGKGDLNLRKIVKSLRIVSQEFPMVSVFR
ncbi:hypothetical protein V2J09_005618 [Rumex salicifolius]